MGAGERLRPALKNRKAIIGHKIPVSVTFELRRKAIHIFGAIVAVPVLLLVPLEWAVGAGVVAMAIISGTYLIAERGERPDNAVHRVVHDRVNHLLESTRREGEGFPWASVLFLASLIIIAVWSHLAGVRLAFAFAAYGILGMGDAGSALIGVAYGRNALPWNSDKSFEGTTAGIVTAFLAAVLLSLVEFAYHGNVYPVEMIMVCAVGAVAGMLLESLPGVQDNLVIPIGAMAAMVGAGAALGLI